MQPKRAAASICTGQGPKEQATSSDSPSGSDTQNESTKSLAGKLLLRRRGRCERTMSQSICAVASTPQRCYTLCLNRSLDECQSGPTKLGSHRWTAPRTAPTPQYYLAILRGNSALHTRRLCMPKKPWPNAHSRGTASRVGEDDPPTLMHSKTAENRALFAPEPYRPHEGAMARPGRSAPALLLPHHANAHVGRQLTRKAAAMAYDISGDAQAAHLTRRHRIWNCFRYRTIRPQRCSTC